METLCHPGELARPAAATIRSVPPHGTRARYVHRTLRCRCPACTRANTAYIRGYRFAVARAAPWHPRTWRQLHLEV